MGDIRHIRLGALIITFCLLMTSCSAIGRRPPRGADEMLSALCSALISGDISSLPWTDSSYAQADYRQIMSAMDDLRPNITIESVDYDSSGKNGTAHLAQVYPFPSQEWKFTSSVSISYRDGGWTMQWSPQVIHPQLTSKTRLSHDLLPAKRAPILAHDGRALVENRTVYRIGLDKTLVDETTQESSARSLAALLNIDADAYVSQVKASGPLAFVEAIVLRQGEVPEDAQKIPGIQALETTRPLAISKEFARPLLGTSGEVNAEQIEKSNGRLHVGDIVGLSGLQARYDEQLRGREGHRISIIARSDEQIASLPASSSPVDGEAETIDPPFDLFSSAPQDGDPLQTTLDIDIQQKVDDVLAPLNDNLYLVAVLDAKTGAVRALGNSPQAKGQNLAATGTYPPGSTMKIASSLAAIRQGKNADSLVACNAKTNIGGRVFTNYRGYPAHHIGQIRMGEALAQSCNTAFMNEISPMSPSALPEAASSLGLGVDYDIGFDAFLGKVPPSDDEVMRAADSIGQGQVTASILAMTSVATSVSAGHTVLPWLIEGHQPSSQAPALTEQEAEILRSMMHEVVSGDGSARYVGDILQAGKTGSAEFGSENPPKTHGLVVGFNDRYAIGVFEYDSTSKETISRIIHTVLS